MHYFTQNPEWKFLFDKGILWSEIIPLFYPHFPTEDGLQSEEDVKSLYHDILSAIAQWSQDSIEPRASHLDELGAGRIENFATVNSAPLEEFYKEARELQFCAPSADVEFGGLGIPTGISLIGFGLVSRACLSSSTQLGFFGSIADMIERFCSKADQEKLVPQIVQGTLSGSMCLTEPGCGSDLSNIKTTATLIANDQYYLNGQKIFITNAGGGLGLVLAKTPNAPAGLNGISLFLALEWITDANGEKKKNYKIVKNEDKMGLHGSFTCQVVYENTVATLIGEQNSGLKMMFHLMNEARLAVGLQALGGLEACMHIVEDYAKTREAFGKNLMDLPLYRKNVEQWKTEIDAIRALVVDTLNYFTIYSKLNLKIQKKIELTPKENKLYRKANKILRDRTPLIKYYASETLTSLSTKAIAALGGYGYMIEYKLERIHRDSFGPLLYEGTSQIQALMALKDLIKTILSKPAPYLLTTIKSNPFSKGFDQLQFQFRTKLLGLLIKTLRPEHLDQLFSAKAWQDEKSINTLMEFAQSICEGLSYLETIKILDMHARVDATRIDLLNRYIQLCRPRFAAIYTEWKQ